MSIDVRHLREAVGLLTNRLPEQSEAESIASSLGVLEELLPWLVLRQNALAKLPEIDQALRKAAASFPSAMTRRPSGNFNSRLRSETESELEIKLDALVAENIKSQSLALRTDAHLSRLVRSTEASEKFDAHHRIAIDHEEKFLRDNDSDC